MFGTIPALVSYVPIDFNEETLDKLLACGFDPSLRTLFMMEGVTQYLTAEAIDATLEWIRVHAAPSSALIFNYQRLSGLPRVHTQRNHVYAVLSRLSGEQRNFGIEKSRIENFMRRRGFTHLEDVNAEQLRRLYCTGSNPGRTVAENYAIVYAEVGERK